MAEKSLNTRICLKYDTYASWNDSTTAGKGANLVLKAGEIGICVVPAQAGADTTEPTVLMKAGDGSTTFANLPWISGPSADVYDWAKKASVLIEQDSSNGHKIRLKLTDGSSDTAPIYSDWITIPDSNTTYSAGTGLSLSGTTFNHSNSITSGSVGSAQSPSHGGTFAIPKISYDAQGHITAAGTVNITLPSDNNNNQKIKAGTVTFGADDVVNIVAGSNVTVTGNATNKEITIAATDTTYSVATASTNGSGGSNGLLSASDKEKIDNMDSAISSAVSVGTASLDGDIAGSAGAGKTLTAFSQTDGVVTATFGNISITKSQISDMPTSLKNPNALTIGGKTYDGSSAISVTASDLGISNAMHFIGVATVAITDGSTTDPTISGYSTKTAGDVILDKDSSREYVWTGSKWELLGGDSSYALSNHNHDTVYKKIQDAVSDPTASGSATTFIDSISQDAQGKITVTKKNVDYSSHSHGNITSGGAITATGVTIASGDALTIVDSSASGKLVKSSITFDGSTATKALTQKGTWETFNNYTHPSITATGNTSTASPAHSGTFTAIDSITVNSNGHVTAYNTKTVTLPAGYSHPTTTAASVAAVKVGKDSLGHVVLGSALTTDDIAEGSTDVWVLNCGSSTILV